MCYTLFHPIFYLWTPVLFKLFTLSVHLKLILREWLTMNNLEKFEKLLLQEQAKTNHEPLKINLWETAIECFSQGGN